MKNFLNTILIILCFATQSYADLMEDSMHISRSGSAKEAKEYFAKNLKGINDILLFEALQNEDYRVALYMLDHGANANAISDNGYSALMTAVKFRRPQIVSKLLDMGADPYYTTKDERSALTIATLMDNGDIPMLEFIKKHKVDLCKKNTLGHTLLMFAIINGASLDVLECLIENGCNVNSTTNDKFSVLQLALIFSDNLQVIDLLLEKGADVTYVRPTDGWSVLDVALDNTCPPELLVKLYDKGARFNKRKGSHNEKEFMKFIDYRNTQVNKNNK